MAIRAVSSVLICFSMALSNLLAQSGNPPDSVHTDATVTLRPVDGVPTIAKIAL